jgi:hypothetical protein
MRKISILILAVMLVSAFLAPAPAQAAWNLPPICSGVMLQNTTASDATTVNFDFYQQGPNSGNPKANYQVPGGIPAGTPKSFYIPDILPSTVPDGIYSVVVTSDQQLNSLVNEDTCRSVTGTQYVGASHAGVSDVKSATTTYLAFVMSHAFSTDWSSQIAIQNADTTDADIKVEFYASGSSTPARTDTFPLIKPGESVYMDLSDVAYANISGFSGAAKITSTNSKKIAAVTNYGPANGMQFLSYNGESQTSQKLYGTQILKNYYGYIAGFTLYNPNATATPISLNFQNPDGTSAGTYLDTVAANSQNLYFLGNQKIGATNNTLPDNFAGGVVVQVTSGSNGLIGIFNFDNRDTARDEYRHSGSANMVRDEDKATTVFIPQLLRKFPMPNGGNFESGFQIFNTTGNAVTLKLTFTNRTGTVTVVNETLAANASKGWSTKQPWASVLGDGFLGGLKIEATGGAVVAHANLNSPYFVDEDGLFMYNAYIP